MRPLSNNVIMAAVIAATVIFMGSGSGRAAQENDFSQVVFYVQCYDVGAAALEGLPGVIKVTKGFMKAKETDTVLYDPKVISREDMVSALKNAGTFVGADLP